MMDTKNKNNNNTKAMRSTQWQWQQPEYDDDQVLEEAEVDEQADLGEVEDDFEGFYVPKSLSLSNTCFH